MATIFPEPARPESAGSGKIVAIVSGGNINLDKFAEIVDGPAH
jgi:hypothetical protein